MKYNKFRKKRYLCKSKVSEHQTNRTMKPTAKKSVNILEKMLEDKKAIQKCIRQGAPDAYRQPSEKEHSFWKHRKQRAVPV